MRGLRHWRWYVDKINGEMLESYVTGTRDEAAMNAFGNAAKQEIGR
jgi:hypothetical protein